MPGKQEDASLFPNPLCALAVIPQYVVSQSLIGRRGEIRPVVAVGAFP